MSNENRQRDNALVLFLDTRLLVGVSGLASQKKQGNKTYILNLITEACKNELQPEAYEELKAKYSLTVDEQKKLKTEKMEKKIAKEERKLRALESNAEAYKKQTYTVNFKTAKELEKNIQYQLRPLLEQRHDLELHLQSETCRPENKAIFKQQYDKVNAEIEKLNIQLETLQSVTK